MRKTKKARALTAGAKNERHAKDVVMQTCKTKKLERK